MNEELILKNAVPGKELTPEEAKALVDFIDNKANQVRSVSAEIDKAKKAADDATTKAKNAKKAAEEIKKITAEREKTSFFGSKTKAVNDIKDDTKVIAEAQVALATAQTQLADAQQASAAAHRKTFEFEEMLAKLTAAMVKIGTMSIATNRIMVRELEARLNGASKEELSELARKELEMVVYQIKAQQDVLSRQEQLTSIVREIDARIVAQEKNDALRDETIEAQMKKGMERDLRISAQERRINDQGRVISHHHRKNAEQDEAIATVNAKNIEQDEAIATVNAKNVEQDEAIATVNAKNVEQDAAIAAGDAKNLEQDKLLTKVMLQNEAQNDRINANQYEIEEHRRILDELTKASNDYAAMFSHSFDNDRRQDADIELLENNADEVTAIIEHIKGKNDEQDGLISELLQLCEKQKEAIDENSKRIDELVEKLELLNKYKKTSKKTFIGAFIGIAVAVILTVILFLL
ncbi:MAG: hypothetical protein IJD22_03640 [Clostridia bacterium]|nr:hypothetical protein [Clostridia bacterium]